MSTFEATGAITLNDVTLSGHTDNPLVSGTLSWSGWTGQNWTGPVVNKGDASALDRELDTFSNAKFTGYYVDVGGQYFGIFKIGSFWILPYNDTNPLNDTNVFPNTSGSTTHFTTALSPAANCFLEGTHVATAGGPRAIETLAPGDLVRRNDGGKTRLRWLWTQRLTHVFGLEDRHQLVRITPHALGPGCPTAELTVTADHAIELDGLLVNAGCLVNGTTIATVPRHEVAKGFTVYHLETESHEVIDVQGIGAESFIDYVPRSSFDNYDAFVAAGGVDRPILEMDLPRISTPRLLPAQYVSDRFQETA